jgi:uncharacterized protein YjbJ (UPF0337 family)
VPADNLGVHAHDQYIEALADTGVLGLLTLGWLLTALFRTALEGVRASSASAEPRDWPWRVAVLASLSAWLLHAVLDDFERFWPANVAFWLIAGLSFSPTHGLLSRAGEKHAQRLKSQNTAPTTRITTSTTRMPPGLASAAAPPPPPKLTMAQIVRQLLTSIQVPISQLRHQDMWAPAWPTVRTLPYLSNRRGAIRVIDSRRPAPMGDRMNEIKGNVKKGLGKVTGNERLEAEGRAEHDTAHASHQAKGMGNQVKGRVEEGVGKMTGDEETRARGVADRLKGDAQRSG